MPDKEPADENISPQPPSKFDREEGSHDPGTRSPATEKVDEGTGGRGEDHRDEDFDDKGRRRRRPSGEGAE